MKRIRRRRAIMREIRITTMTKIVTGRSMLGFLLVWSIPPPDVNLGGFTLHCLVVVG